MSQNTSSAVMQQRHEARDALDDFPTPPWATRALFEHVIIPRLGRLALAGQVAWEPCCNRGHMSVPLESYFARVISTDVHDYGFGRMDGLQDFLLEPPPTADVPLWAVFNPPFRLGGEFIHRTFDLGIAYTAAFVRTSFLEGDERYRNIFRHTPPTIVAQFVERVILSKGIVRDPAVSYWDEKTQTMKRPSTATSYCWLVWIRGMAPQPFQWIPKCRTALERPGDYCEVMP